MLAYSIYIIGTRKFLPDEGKVSNSYQRDAFKDALQHFLKRRKTAGGASPSSSSSSSPSSSSSSSSSPSPPLKEATGARKAEHLHSHFYININNEEERNLVDGLFLHPIIHVGEVVAGDEKLFHYTAHHMNTKAVPQKKDVSISNPIEVLCNSSLFFFFTHRLVCGYMSWQEDCPMESPSFSTASS